MRAGWHDHPGVRAGHELTYGERAADRLRNGMGSWTFVFVALAFLAAWMGYNRGTGFDRYPFILLNLVLSCLAALQGAILLIAARRSDQIASELARHDYHADVKAEKLVEKLTTQYEHMAAQHEALHRQVAELTAALQAASGQAPPAPRQARAAE
jgi:uncharacterized membrane protein